MRRPEAGKEAPISRKKDSRLDSLGGKGERRTRELLELSSQGDEQEGGGGVDSGEVVVSRVVTCGS